MSYIKFDIINESGDDSGKLTCAAISRIRSDIADKSINELNIILHVLSILPSFGGKSCFSSGYWQGNKPWDGKDAWINYY